MFCEIVCTLYNYKCVNECMLSPSAIVVVELIQEAMVHCVALIEINAEASSYVVCHIMLAVLMV